MTDSSSKIVPSRKQQRTTPLDGGEPRSVGNVQKSSPAASLEPLPFELHATKLGLRVRGIPGLPEQTSWAEAVVGAGVRRRLDVPDALQPMLASLPPSGSLTLVSSSGESWVVTRDAAGFVASPQGSPLQQAQQLTAALRTDLSLLGAELQVGKRGLELGKVPEASPASSLGLRRGDVLTSVGQTSLAAPSSETGRRSLTRTLGELAAQTKGLLVLHVERAGEAVTFEVPAADPWWRQSLELLQLRLSGRPIPTGHFLERAGFDAGSLLVELNGTTVEASEKGLEAVDKAAALAEKVHRPLRARLLTPNGVETVTLEPVGQGAWKRRDGESRTEVVLTGHFSQGGEVKELLRNGAPVGFRVGPVQVPGDDSLDSAQPLFPQPVQSATVAEDEQAMSKARAELARLEALKGRLEGQRGGGSSTAAAALDRIEAEFQAQSQLSYPFDDQARSSEAAAVARQQLVLELAKRVLDDGSLSATQKRGRLDELVDVASHETPGEGLRERLEKVVSPAPDDGAGHGGGGTLDLLREQMLEHLQGRIESGELQGVSLSGTTDAELSARLEAMTAAHEALRRYTSEAGDAPDSALLATLHQKFWARAHQPSPRPAAERLTQLLKALSSHLVLARSMLDKVESLGGVAPPFEYDELAEELPGLLLGRTDAETFEHKLKDLEARWSEAVSHPEALASTRPGSPHPSTTLRGRRFQTLAELDAFLRGLAPGKIAILLSPDGAASVQLTREAAPFTFSSLHWGENAGETGPDGPSAILGSSAILGGKK